MPEAIRKEVMGHRNIATAQRYTHVRPVHEIPAHERLAEAVPVADLVTATPRSAFSVSLRFPDAAPQWRDRPDRRVTLLDRFPFRIPYQIAGEEIVVLAFAHASRRPNYWSRRDTAT